MKTIIVYRPISEHARKVDEFAHELTRRYPETKLELLNIDTRDGAATASIYDITRYPAVLAVNEDGSSKMVWQDTTLPLIDEVAGYNR